MALDDDDELFDWAAAVAEIDLACSRANASSFENGGGADPSSSQSRALTQKTLDSFVQSAAIRQRPITAHGGGTYHGRQGVALDSFPGIQRPTATHFRPQEFSSRAGGSTSNGSDVPLDYDAARIWIYPVNIPRRSYQFSITKSALFGNTLVCLPTGLGKTLIAAVVMYNYFRWFPTGKIVFAAPSRPLVVQQIEACHKVTGVPQHMTIDMTGQMNPQMRAEHWQSKRIFFVTPQVLEKDIKSGRCATKQIVCLVVDEAHRATGNYSYCVVVRELLAKKVEPRILALTATPGSKQSTIQDVVDNLQISSLEYRDEHDPEVSKYTHNRTIELIEVPLNAESTQVKDVFIEVVQPIVQRLCYLGVFYNREMTRLTPYEFITARDRFRQSPPPTLQQCRYPEVENYFGLAITLFHIFKLLMTHGMRPAFEMLQQKMEQGILKKLARNEKLCEVQDLMKQSIGHGAPSPKLEKVADIINDHFSVRDATNTRVIIFTNYRESVKDIMEKLAASCPNVKAMEFIGQSSGKNSKGQTQKTQQAVLQKFRGGCFNTIVATSIGEEGLDIMEVDLVICFDANISPLRMIQRMGRTGRKRDGQVVVLASGGAEVQGYLKKQSKSKVLGKHMLNGGLQSFNFHPSHHMIPHKLQTTVQFLELCIEDFVPRGRKQKEKDREAATGSRRKLTERELEMLRLIKELPGVKPGVPSKSADPENPFRAGPVHVVKHSKRSCVLIDVLQKLRVPVHPERETQLSKEGYMPTETEAAPAQSTNPHADAKVSLPREARGVRVASSPIELDASPARSSNPHAVAEVSSPREARVVQVISSPIQIDASVVRSSFPHVGTESFSPSPVRDIEVIAAADNKARIAGVEEKSYHFTSDRSDLSDHKIFVDEHDYAAGVHCCRFSSGFVSVAKSGLVLIASPPSILSSGRGINGMNISTSQFDAPISRSARLQQPKTQLPNGIPAFEDRTDVVKVERTGGGQSYATTSLPHSVTETQNPLGSFAAAQEKKIGDCSLTESVEQDRVIQIEDSDFEELTPPLAGPVNDVVVPSTPYMTFQPDLEKIPVPASHGLEEELNNRSSTVRDQITPKRAEKGIPCHSRPLQSTVVLETSPSSPHFHLDSTDSHTIPGASEDPRPVGFDRSKPGRQAQVERPVPAALSNGSASEANLQQTCGDHSKLESRAPVQISGGNSSRDDWQINPSEPLGSVKRPRKLKRLLRIGEKRLAGASKADSKGVQNASARDLAKGKGHDQSNARRGERQRKNFAARAFIDEEAEASSDEEGDDSSESGECNEENGESSESFIDTRATQHVNGSVEMMAIYRKSLLTPSPLGSLGAKWSNMQQQGTTPASDVTGSSIESSVVSSTFEDKTPEMSPLRRSNLSSKFADHQNAVKGRPPTVDVKFAANAPRGKLLTPIQVNAMVDIPSRGPEVQEKQLPEVRKRKLSFEGNSGYEDDLFEGVDLDALEAEAAEKSRSRLEGQTSKGFQTLSSAPSQITWSACSAQNARSRLQLQDQHQHQHQQHESELHFFPSFDLGLDD